MTLNKWSGSSADGTATAGQFNWAMAVTAPLFMFANLRFRAILATDATSQYRLSDYFGIRAVLVAAMGLAVGSVAFRLFQTGETDKALLVLAMAAVKAVEAFSDLCCGLQQRVDRMDRIAASLIANGLSMLAAFVVLYASTGDLFLATLGMLAARLLVLAVLDVPLARHAALAPCFQAATTRSATSTRLRQLMLAAVPLGITAGLLSLTSNIPKYILPRVFDMSMLGIYGTLAVSLQAGNLVFRAVELPAMPRLARLIIDRDAAGFWRLLRKLIGVFVVIGVVGCVVSLSVGGWLLSCLFNPAYQSMGPVLALFVVGTVLAQIAGIIESALIAARLTAVQIPMHGITVGMCFLLSWALIPSMNIYGAVLAVTVCRFPFMGIGLWLLRQKLAEPRMVENHSPQASSFSRRAA